MLTAKNVTFTGLMLAAFHLVACGGPEPGEVTQPAGPGGTPTGPVGAPGVAPVNPGQTPGVAPTPGVNPGQTPGVAPTPGVNPGETPGVTPTPGMTPVGPGTAVAPSPTMPGTGVNPVAPAPAPTDPNVPAPVPTDPNAPPATPAPVSNGDKPPGWYTTSGWGGCVWTGVEAEEDVGASGQSTIAPNEFLDVADGGPYCVSGTVAAHEAYESVALLGFNLGEDPATANCTALDPTADFPVLPAVQPTGTGIAVNFVKQGADTSFVWRVQIQGPNGGTDANERWCATIAATQGKVHVPYSDFNTECWEGGMGTDYAGEPISSVVFLVPGEPTATPYEFCVNGFADGDSADAAPDGSAVAATEMGTVGYSELSPDGDFDRKKILAGGNEYILQNNNWGNPEGSDLIMSYVGNSFSITTANGSSPGNGIPASFPSIFIGDNGNSLGGVASTTTDPLPIQISAIQSAQTTFTWNGVDGDFNATYDVWFANSPPAAEYRDGIDGFVMVWLYKPGSRQPIGSVTGNATIAGHTWEVWEGPRGDGPEGYNDAPVVSYVSPTKLNTLTFDLKDFMVDAASHGIPSSMYLTDVFGGFEIWGGGSNLEMQEFSIDVQ